MSNSDGRALDANMMRYWVGYGAAAGGVIEEPGRVAYLTPVPNPLFNGAIVSFVHDGLEDFARAVGAALAKAGGGGLWWLSPTAVAAGAADRLIALGLHEAGTVPAMTVDLGSLPPADNRTDLTIRPAESAADRALWGDLAARGTGFEDPAVRALAALEPRIPAERLEGQVRLLAEYDGKAVATGALVMSGDLAGAYAISTLPDFRRRGIGRAITQYALQLGVAGGARTGVLQSTPMGRPIYESLGFREIFSYRLLQQG
ncbi:MAG: GNAT family N-acetyltransferase [Caulobacterales bacterium]|nr:GNAT family N-acetyltransferase [Caulobacterales bacterium]